MAETSPRTSPVWTTPDADIRGYADAGLCSSEILLRVGCRATAGNRQKLALRFAELGIPALTQKHGHTSGRRGRVWKLSRDDFIALLRESYSISDVLASLGLATEGRSRQALRARALEEGVNDLVPDGRRGPRRGRTPLGDVLVENGTFPRVHLKKRLIQEGRLANRCAVCAHPPEWKGRPLVLILDHINGVNDDNRIENLRLLCPNCNSQTDTFAGRNIKRRSRPDRLAA